MPSLTDFLFSVDASNPFSVGFYLFKQGGWLAFVISGIWICYDRIHDILKHKWRARQKFILLAVDIPKDNEQSYLAVEQIFNQIAGMHKDPNLVEIYLEGEIQLSVSLEIVSNSGYIQFFIHTPKKFRDTIEAAFYAQYPDAEITEVEDYIHDLPETVPNDRYDLWGAEFILTGPQWSPVRTYPNFEDKLLGKNVDPLAALLEMMSRIQPDEHVWVQLLITPVNYKWKEGGIKLVKKIAKIKEDSKPSGIEKVLGVVTYIGEETIGAGLGIGSSGGKEEGYVPASQMMHLTPGQKAGIEGIERKINKIGYKSRFRIIYVGPHEVFSKKRVASPLVGAIKQFNNNDGNGFKPDPVVTTNKPDYFFVKSRTKIKQHRIFQYYKARRDDKGASGGAKILNTEEIASLWHFPLIDVKAPLPTKLISKKKMPPPGLPTNIPGLRNRNQPEPETNVENPLEGIENEAYQEEYQNEGVQNQEGIMQNENQRDGNEKNIPPPNLPI